MQRINNNSEGENGKGTHQKTVSAEPAIEPEIEYASDEDVQEIMNRICVEDADLLQALA